MDFQTYIHNLREKIIALEESNQFLLKYRINPPAFEEDIQDMEEEISTEENMEDFKVWEPIRQFYQVANGFELSWQYLGHEDESRITCGSAKIPVINAIFEPEEKIGQPFSLIYQETRLFDWIGTESNVNLKFSSQKKSPDLLYFTSRTKSCHLLSIEFPEYLNFLLQTRGLYPWQEFFIDDENFKRDPGEAQQFLSDLELLFPDVDKSNFMKR